MEASQTRVLEGNQLVNMDEVVTQSHLVLFLCLVQVAIDHLQDGVLSVHLTIVVLLVYLHLLFQLFCLCHTHNLTPMGKNLHSVEVSHLLLFVHRVFEVVTPQLHLFLLLIQVLEALVLVADLDEGALLVGCRGLTIILTTVELTAFPFTNLPK
jgi:hypothetical protein